MFKNQKYTIIKHFFNQNYLPLNKKLISSINELGTFYILNLINFMIKKK